MSLLILRRGHLLQSNYPKIIKSCSFNIKLWLRHSSMATALSKEDYLYLRQTRNIGIIAHIDAGKTTTTERMLYYSGITRYIGDVDEGSTVTDFLPSERARGITIQSAVVTFHWPPVNKTSSALPESPRSFHSHKINLIDTPGHADFTFEVLRSLRVLDGAICILDAVSGVEAQTENVWAQAHKYKIPRIVFVNKMDRTGATFERTVKEIANRLRGFPILCQIPWWEVKKGDFSGIGDVVNLCALKWEPNTDGKNITRFSIEELARLDPKFCEEITKARNNLVEILCGFDEKLLESWLSVNDNSLAVKAQDIRDSLRRCIADGSGKIIPVFLGASLRNIGVQPLMDAVNDLLPDPTERPDPEIKLGARKSNLRELISGKPQLYSSLKGIASKKSNTSLSMAVNLEACALAFKVVNDTNRGVLVYIRVYSGSIKRNSLLWNTNLQITEKPLRILKIQASDVVEIGSIDAGQIGVVVGLNHTRTGDTLISNSKVNPKSGPPVSIRDLVLNLINIPPPVFFAAIEPHRCGEEKNVVTLLSVLLREDPSLQMSIDNDSGQLILSGMGELHLEIARDRLINDFKAQASMGDIRINYREHVLSASLEKRVDFDKEIAGKRVRASCTASVKPSDQNLGSDHTEKDNYLIYGENSITVNIIPATENVKVEDFLPLSSSSSPVRTALVNGAVAALARGPRCSFPLHKTHVTITYHLATDFFGKQSSTAALSSAAKLAVQATLKDSFLKNQIAIMEPVMSVLISCDEASLGAVVHDISTSCAGQILTLWSDGDHKNLYSDMEPVDLQKVYVPKDPFAGDFVDDTARMPSQRRQVKARVPLKEMVGYLKHLRSLTAGRGSFIMYFDKFERLLPPRDKFI